MPFAACLSQQGRQRATSPTSARRSGFCPSWPTHIPTGGGPISNRRDYDRALADFTRALELKPKMAGVRQRAGTSLYATKDFPHAVAEYDATIAVDPSSANYAMRGNASHDMGDDAKALDDLNEAIRLKPDNAAALGWRTDNIQKTRRYTKQIADLKQLIKIYSDVDTYYITLAHAYRKIGDNEHGIYVLEQFIRRKPDVAMLIGSGPVSTGRGAKTKRLSPTLTSSSG